MRPRSPLLFLPLLLTGCATSGAPPDPAEVFANLPERARLLTPEAGSGAPMAVEELYRGPSQNSLLVKVGRPVPLHVHEHSEESVYLLQGSGTLHLTEEAELAVGAGDFVVVPRGVPHGYTPDEGESSLVLSIFSPPLREGDRIPVDAAGRRIEDGRP